MFSPATFYWAGADTRRWGVGFHQGYFCEITPWREKGKRRRGMYMQGMYMYNNDNDQLLNPSQMRGE